MRPFYFFYFLEFESTPDGVPNNKEEALHIMTIEDLINKAAVLTDSLKNDPEELCVAKSLGIDGKEFPGIDLVLTIVGAIKKVQGTDKIYQTVENREDIKSKLNTLKETLINIQVDLDSESELSKADVRDILESNGLDADLYYIITAILSHLNIAISAGKGRLGGIKLYNKAESEKEIRDAEDEINKVKDPKELSESEEKHEKVLYEPASKVISDEGYSAVILGVNRRLKGEWNTPDVIGYKIVPYQTIGGCFLEIITVEAKWSLNKQAIAETSSHQKFSHKSYLMVNQSYDEIESSSLIRDLVDKGLGLICKDASNYYIHIPAANNYPHGLDVDNFISEALSEQKESIKTDIATHFFKDYFAKLMPK